MKKTLLTLSLVVLGSWAYSQIVVSGVSPAAIQGSYEFRTQANTSAWPDPNTGNPYADDGTWGAIAPNFNLNGTFIQDTLMLIDDGTPGTNAQGHPIAQEGCSPAINDLTGKIAVIYRNTCDFAAKIYNAQVAGAVAVIIVNREDEVLGMTAATPGPGQNVTIPAVFISSISGDALISEMDNGPVVVFIGNKIGVYGDDIGTNINEVNISPFASNPTLIDNGFDVGCVIYNFGSNDQTNITATATIDGPSGNVYTESVGSIVINSGDTAYVFNGEAYEFPSFTLPSYTPGMYTLTYTISTGGVDESDYDNTITTTFEITSDRLSLGRVDASGDPIATSYPFGLDKPADYQSCMFFQDPNASNLVLEGLSFVPFIDTADVTANGQEIIVYAYEWNNTWTDLNDESYFGTTATQNPFDNLTILAYGEYYLLDDADSGQPAYAPLQLASSPTTPIVLEDNQRYLFCTVSFDTNVVFGYDNTKKYDMNERYYAMPISPVKAESSPGVAQWYVGGWGSLSAPSISLHVSDAALVGLNDETIVNGKAFPNPTKNDVTIALEANGSGKLNVTDISGKVALSQSINLVNGKTNVDLSSLEDGVYIFNVELENGKTSQFNVVKN